MTDDAWVDARYLRIHLYLDVSQAQADADDEDYDEIEMARIMPERYDMEWVNGICHLLFYPGNINRAGIRMTGIPEIPFYSSRTRLGCLAPRICDIVSD